MEIRNGEVRLHVSEDGDPEAPPVVLLHGITSSVATWDWLVPHLVEHHRVLRLDFRGHGRSDRTPGAYGFPGYIGDAAAVCAAAGRPCVVIGHSLGGGTAAGLAQQQPELVRAVVLEDPPLAGAGEALETNLLDAFRLMREAVPRLQASSIPHEVLVATLAAAPSAAGPTFGEVLHPDAIGAMATSLLQLDATVLDPVLDGTAVPGFDASRPLPVDGLVLAADPASPDAVVRPVDLERLAATSPQVARQVVSGAGHLIHDEIAHRDAFLAAALGFLASLA